MPDSSLEPRDVTELLHAWRSGNPDAQDQLWPVIYGELKGLARSQLRRQPRGKLGATTLVHEAYLRLVGKVEIDWNDREHFFAVAARAMRFVLVDEARRRMAEKRRALDTKAEIPENVSDPVNHQPEDVVAIHRALERLSGINPRYERLVEMRYFAGLSIDETAEVLHVSRPTVVRDWRAVRTWLYGELSSASGPSSSAASP